MSQQINLFNPIFLKQKKYFSAATMAQALGLILAGTVLVVAFVYYQAAQMQQRAQSVSAQLASSQAQLVIVNAQFGLRPKNAALEAEIQHLEAENLGLQQVFDILQRGDFGNTRGYADYLRAFARQITDGIWITGFHLVGAGNEIGMQGRALRPEAVPEYINRLKREPVMLGKSFATLEMQVPLIEQAPVADAASPASPPKLMPAAYIEFNLQSSARSQDSAASTEAKTK